MLEEEEEAFLPNPKGSKAPSKAALKGASMESNKFTGSRRRREGG